LGAAVGVEAVVPAGHRVEAAAALLPQEVMLAQEVMWEQV